MRWSINIYFIILNTNYEEWACVGMIKTVNEIDVSVYSYSMNVNTNESFIIIKNN